MARYLSTFRELDVSGYRSRLADVLVVDLEVNQSLVVINFKKSMVGQVVLSAGGLVFYFECPLHLSACYVIILILLVNLLP